MFSSAITRVPVYTAISNFENSCSQRFEVEVVLNSTNYIPVYIGCVWRMTMNKHPIKCICIHNLQIICI